MLDYPLRYGLVLTETDDGRGVAIWVSPGQSMTPGGLVRSGMRTAAFQVGLTSMARFARANAVIDPVHKRAVSQPHWPFGALRC